ncbi:MAG: hypothetical protein OXT65_13170 [Alphaproteobacteria bacterium]|nr:hypothetical protein [Alphaproteobacteria bacterium]
MARNEFTAVDQWMSGELSSAFKKGVGMDANPCENLDLSEMANIGTTTTVKAPGSGLG